MTKTTTEKNFSTLDAENLFSAKTLKNKHAKTYTTLGALAKTSLNHGDVYTYNTKKHGKLDVSVTDSQANSFNLKEFTKDHPELVKKYTIQIPKVTLSIKKQKK